MPWAQPLDGCPRLFRMALMLTVLLAMPLAAAQSASSSSSSLPPSPTSSSVQSPPPLPTPAPGTAPLPPGTRDLRDGIVLADMVPIGQGQTYHLSLGPQPQSLPVRRQLERLIHAPDHSILLDKRQAAPNSTTPTITASSSSSSPSSSPSSPPTTRIAPGPANAPTSPGQDGTTAVYISISTCVTPKSSDPAAVCPPLILYVSTSSQITLPGPGMSPDEVAVVTSTEGLIQYTAHVQNDLFFSVYSPAMQGAWTGAWSIEVGASSQGFTQRYDSAPGLVLDDTDNTHASFLTHNFTMGSVPTFKIYLVPASQYPPALSRSLCAIDAIHPTPLTKATMTITETNRTTYLDSPSTYGVLPGDPNPAVNGVRRQVRISSLQPGSDYLALFMTDVLQQSGAEVLYAMTPLRTKRHDNCLLLTDLSFCHEVAYAVPVTPLSSIPGPAPPPGNNTNLLQAEVGKLYDDFARNLMDNFDKVLAQYDCTLSSYSLIRNCSDCSRAYRRWLCSVSLPRCTDMEEVQNPANLGYHEWASVSSDDLQNPYLKDGPGPAVVPRDNSSSSSSSRGALAQLQAAQNPLFQPGPYAEVLPCIDLCYDVVQSCPSFLGFGCPKKNMAGSYAPMRPSGFQCNGLGLVSIPAASSLAASTLDPHQLGWATATVVMVASTLLNILWVAL